MSRCALRGDVLAEMSVIDFLAVLFGYAISGERTLEAFYERLQPFAVPFMAQVSPGPAPFPLGALALFSADS